MAFNGLNNEYGRASEILEDVLRQALQPVETILLSACEEAGLAYGGIDASMNPGLSVQESVGAGIENLTPHIFGAAGTLAAACAITTAVKGLKKHIQLTGYSGLMLPVMEDLILSRRAGKNIYLEIIAFYFICFSPELSSYAYDLFESPALV